MPIILLLSFVAALHVSHAYHHVVVMRGGTDNVGDGGAHLLEKPGFADTPGRKNQLRGPPTNKENGKF